MKNKKLIGLASLFFVLGATGCPKTDKPEEPKPGEIVDPTVTPETCTKHDYEKKTIKEATCTEKGQTQRVCKVCGYEENPKDTSALGHAYVDDATGGTAATCTEKGLKNQTCSRCGDKKTVELDALGHDWVDDETGGVAATCETAGSKNQHCSRCDATQENVPVEALGHAYGEWTTVEGKAPKCEEKGEEKHVCSRCDKEETREVAALGHNFQLIGDDTEPEAGKAKVRLYTCVNEGCDKTSLGFKANEVSDESKQHLTIGEDGGAAFWGRPIGNSLALDANGTSVNQTPNECVYCSTETGDFFEYVFDLTAQQAAELETCRCYCDAKPADYLSGDFWAYNASSDDWTPGFYIDGADEHVEKNEDNSYVMVEDHARCEKGSASAGDALGEDHMVKKGKRITDYRYVLYVDDQIQSFDPDTKVTVEGSGTNTVRKEYEMPFTFRLHEGTNKISLRMAGGYRSTFYNFTFRTYVAPTPITVNESALEVREGKTVAITGASQEGVTYTSSNTNIATVDANGVVTGVKAGDATITVSKEGNFKDTKVAVKVLEKEGVVTLNLLDAVIAPEDGIARYDSSSSGTWYRNPKNGGTMTYNFQSEVAGKFDIILGLRHNSGSLDLATNMGIKVNGADVTVAGTVQTQYDAVEYVVGQADLNVGDNTMVISFLADSSLYIKSLKFVPHVHDFGDVTDVAAVEGGAMKHGEATCACGAKRISLGALDGTFAAGSSNKTGTPVPPEGFLKLNANGNSISYNFSAAAAGKATFAVEAVMDNFQGGNGSNNTRTLESGKGNGKPYNITFKVDYKDGEEDKTNDVDMSAIGTTLYDDLFDKVPDGETAIASNHSAITTFEIGTANVGAGMNTLTITRNGSYNFIIRTIYVIL